VMPAGTYMRSYSCSACRSTPATHDPIPLSLSSVSVA
jgi:hypothetical protein